MQDFLNWGKATAGGDGPEQGGPHFVPGVKVGELCPGHTDTVVVLGIGSRFPFSDGKISSRLPSRRGSPMSVMGLRSSGTGQGKGQEREARP